MPSLKGSHVEMACKNIIKENKYCYLANLISSEQQLTFFHNVIAYKTEMRKFMWVIPSNPLTDVQISQ